MTRQKILAIALTWLMVVSAVTGTALIGTVGFSSTVSAANAPTNPSFNVTDGYQVKQSGQSYQAIDVNSTSNTTLRNFNVFYNDTGPLNLSNGGVVEAQYFNGTTKSSGTLELNQSMGGGGVTLLLDPNQAGFTKQPTRMNVTVYNHQDPASTSAENKSLLTLNYVAFNLTNSSGDPVSTFFRASNSSTNLTTAAGLTDEQGYFALHCRGFIEGTDCMDPDGNAGSLVVHAGTTTKGRELFIGSKITTERTVSAMNLRTGNATSPVSIAPKQPQQLTTDIPTAAIIHVASSVGSGPSASINAFEVIDPETDTTLHQWKAGLPGPPPLLKPNKRYVTRANISVGSSFVIINRTHVTPTSGAGQIDLRVASRSLSRTKVVGQVVNDSGSPVSGAVVYAQRSGRTDPFATPIINSTVTGSNGKFSMTVPDSKKSGLRYQFSLISNRTNGSVPIHYPTTDNNANRGYQVTGQQTILPPLAIKDGGRVDVSVSSGNESALTAFMIGELSATSSRTGAETRADVSNELAQVAVPPLIGPPTAADVEFTSPTTSGQTQVSYSLWGFKVGSNNPTVDRGCTASVTVDQGVRTHSNCTFNQTGRLNLSVTLHDSLLRRTNSRQSPVAAGFYLFENQVIIRNASSGNVTLFLDSEGTLGGFLRSAENQRRSPRNLSIPLPPGNYTVELRPAHDFVRKTSTSDKRTIEVTASNSSDLNLNRSRAFAIKPAPGRFNPSLERSKSNTIAVKVGDEATGQILTDATVNVTGRLHHPNGSTATGSFEFTYNSTDQTFETTIDPQSLGVKAGKYQLEVTASNETTTAVYNSTRSGPVTVTGFQVGLDMGGFTFGLGETVSASLFAFNTSADPPEGINASASNITVEIYDENGRLINSTSPASGITQGRGSLDVTLPQDRGFYRIATFVQADDGRQGVSENWVRVSDLDVDTSTDKDVYGPSDTVKLTVSVANATSGAAITGATVEGVVDGNASVGGVTDSNGEVTLTLDPGSLASGGTWSGGFHFIDLTVSSETDSGIIRVRTGQHFRVESLDAFVEPTQRTYSPGQNATVNVFVPPNRNIQSVEATVLDSRSISKAGTKRDDGFWQIDLGQPAVGDHGVTVTVSTASDSQDFQTRFSVSQYNIEVDSDQFRYETGEQVNLSVTVTHATNGTAVNAQPVNATLYQVSSPSDLKQATASGTTDSSGVAKIRDAGFTSQTGGDHYVEVRVGKQRKFVGIQINSVNVTLLDSLGGQPTSQYTVEPGSTGRIYLNATNTTSGAAVADGSRATAFLSAFGDTFQLNSNTTTNGQSVLSFEVPESAPERRYGLKIRVTTPGGDQGTVYGTLRVSGSSALTIRGSLGKQFYRPNENATLTTTLTYGNGTPVSGRNVSFAIGAPGGSLTTVGTATTSADGSAAVTHTISPNRSEGDYILRVSLTNRTDVKDVTGFRITNLAVSVTANQSTYSQGGTIGLTVNATNSTSGEPVNATDGAIRVVAPTGERIENLDVSGKSPYRLNLSIPGTAGAVGSYTFQAGVRRNASVGFDSTFVNVVNATATLNVTAPSTITAGDTVPVQLNASVDTSASLTVFSPGAGTILYQNSSLALASDTPKNDSLSISSPGVYVIKASAPALGSQTTVIQVESQNVSVWTGPSLSKNTTAFNRTQDIYIKSNTANATATVIGNSTTYTVPLNQQNGSTHYGVLATKRAVDIYLVRLDLPTSTAADSTIIEVSS